MEYRLAVQACDRESQGLVAEDVQVGEMNVTILHGEIEGKPSQQALKVREVEPRKVHEHPKQVRQGG
jgi:hypothetical protein